MAIINCSKCGNAYDSANSHCPFCGQQTVQVPPTQEAPRCPSYPQQVPYYTAPSHGKTGSGFGWIVFLRVILWIVFGAIVLSSLIIGIRMMSFSRYFGGMAWEGMLVIFGGILTAFITIAAGMVALNNASNLNKIATNSAKILDELQKK